MAKRSGVLEFAVLGLLHESPMHGYELRKRLSSQLGTFRALSYGSLYPCLKSLVRQGYIAESADPAEPGNRRSKIVYQLTAEGKEHFQTLLGDSGPAAWDDETFGVRLAFFGRTDADTRNRNWLFCLAAIGADSLATASSRACTYSGETRSAWPPAPAA